MIDWIHPSGAKDIVVITIILIIIRTQWLGVEVWEVGGEDEEQLGEKMGRDQGEVGEGDYVIMMMVMVI